MSRVSSAWVGMRGGQRTVVAGLTGATQAGAWAMGYMGHRRAPSSVAR